MSAIVSLQHALCPGLELYHHKKSSRHGAVGEKGFDLIIMRHHFTFVRMIILKNKTKLRK